jgi:hypothetical protein
MEGISKIYYKNKTIYYIDYSAVENSKEKTLELLKGITEEYKRQQLPPKSVLALTNIANRQFDMDILNAFKAERERTSPYEKKVAVIGMSGLQKVAYNFIVSLTQKDLVKAFNTEIEAKEWLVSD